MHNFLQDQITKLKKEKNAILLSHFYQEDEIQDIADYIGDSLQLARVASNTNADIIIFCGVKFMGETAKILNPDKKVIIPDMNAGCSLESSCCPSVFAKFISKYHDHTIVNYINSSIEIKAMSDYIVTSSNAEAIIRSISTPIIFGPDKNLGLFLEKKTNKKMILWPGVCIVHENFSEQELIKLKTKYKNAIIIAHPECNENILQYASYIGSTSNLIDYTKKFFNQEFIVLTEKGILNQMQKSNSTNQYYFLQENNSSYCKNCSICPFMKLNTLEKILICLKNESNEILISDNLLEKAKVPLMRMLQF